MIDRVKTILEALKSEKILEKRDVFYRYRNTLKTQKAITHIVKYKYAFSFNSFLVKAPVNYNNLKGINPKYALNDLGFIKDRLSCINTKVKRSLAMEVSVIDWCYVLYRDGYRYITTQFISGISGKNYQYARRQLNELSVCGYIDRKGEESDEFVLKHFIPNFGATDLTSMAKGKDLLPKKEVVERKPKPRRIYAKEPKMSTAEMLDIANRYAIAMNPCNNAEKRWMIANFVSALEWANKE